MRACIPVLVLLTRNTGIKALSMLTFALVFIGSQPCDVRLLLERLLAFFAGVLRLSDILRECGKFQGESQTAWRLLWGLVYYYK